MTQYSVGKPPDGSKLRVVISLFQDQKQDQDLLTVLKDLLMRCGASEIKLTHPVLQNETSPVLQKNASFSRSSSSCFPLSPSSSDHQSSSFPAQCFVQTLARPPFSLPVLSYSDSSPSASSFSSTNNRSSSSDDSSISPSTPAVLAASSSFAP
jgi:hypothetical protein